MRQRNLPSGQLNVKILAAVGLMVIAGLVWRSASSIIGEHKAYRARLILRDSVDDTKYVRIDLNEEHYNLYLKSLKLLNGAHYWDPRNSGYSASLAELLGAMGRYGEVMSMLSLQKTELTANRSLNMKLAEKMIRRAIVNDPLQPYYHIYLAGLLIEIGEKNSGSEEYEKAIRCAPYSAALRYMVAMEYLKMRMHDDAIRHARVLANIDETYASRRINARSNSYLFRALEIVWTASGKDVQSIIDATPRNSEAREVLSMFLESKGF